MKDFQKAIIEKYIIAYNNFDVDGMVKNLHKDIVFENITHGEVDLRTEGLAEFKKQAKTAKQYFTKRKQTIKTWDFQGDKVIIEISYEGILAIDLPGGVNVGDILSLNGQSEFIFKEGEIISIKDKS